MPRQDRGVEGHAVRASLDETRAAVARMQVKFGIDPPKAELERLIAQRIGPDSFLLNGKVLSGEEVEAAVMEQLAEDHEHDELRADLGPSLKDANVHTRAMRLLSERGVWEPDGPTYLRACQEVGAR